MQRWRLGICALLGTLVLVACGGDETTKKSTTSSSAPPTPQITQPSGEAPRVIEVTLAFVAPRFRPDPIVVQVGKPVQFKLTSADTRHHLVIESLGIDLEVPQKSLEESVTTGVVTPQETGMWRMFCRIHSRMAMEGTLQVTDTAAGN
jgi:plastocyanin